MTKKYTLSDVAKFLLQEFGSMTTMKLQKLCYYVQAWHLVIKESPLFDSDFYAWDNGPVATDLYELHRGKYSISEGQIKGSPITDPDDSTFIKSIAASYFNFSGDELSTISHMETPWLKAKEISRAEGKPNVLITKESMLSYYSGLDESNSVLIS